ncbi:MAG: DUF4157 domain-containing protein [Nitrosomonas sp.]|nr:DUF4157 domain-containing protein [Nitrosomonas sp.]
MNIHADKTQENKSKSLANSVAKKQGDNESTFQFVDNRPEAIMQRKLQEMANNSPQALQLRVFQGMANSYSARQQQLIQKKENNTGLPDNLKTGIESLSGYSMDDVKVHYNSDKPAQLQAHAYAQGTDIHIASGQEKHLPHEAWHVVQQKQGKVKPTLQMKGKININDDAGLEKEADVMGAKALRPSNTQAPQIQHATLKPDRVPFLVLNPVTQNMVIQLNSPLDSSKLNVVGENHEESNYRRKEEKNIVKHTPIQKNIGLKSSFKCLQIQNQRKNHSQTHLKDALNSH